VWVVADVRAVWTAVRLLPGPCFKNETQRDTAGRRGGRGSGRDLAGRPVPVAPAALAVAAGVTLALVLVAADELAALFRPMPVEASLRLPGEQ
jgi:hypothetical protein